MARYRIQRIVVGPRQVPTIGLKRRVRALATRGWGQREIAERIGMAEINFRKVVQQQLVRREVHAAVKEVYRDLWWKDGPNYLARCNARKKGWPGPMDWSDPDNPAEIPLCEVERAHREALEMHRALKKNEARRESRRQSRPALRVLEGGRQAGRQVKDRAQQKAAMAT
jgi:hypothetical protein